MIYNKKICDNIFRPKNLILNMKLKLILYMGALPYIWNLSKAQLKSFDNEWLDSEVKKLFFLKPKSKNVSFAFNLR